MYVARDLNGFIHIYGMKPQRRTERFMKDPSDDFNPLPLPIDCFTEVTWQSSPCKLKAMWRDE